MCHFVGIRFDVDLVFQTDFAIGLSHHILVDGLLDLGDEGLRQGFGLLGQSVVRPHLSVVELARDEDGVVK